MAISPLNRNLAEIDPSLFEDRVRDSLNNGIDASIVQDVVRVTMKVAASNQPTRPFDKETVITEMPRELSSIRSLDDFLPIVKSAKPGITFWGWRYVNVIVQGSPLKLPMDTLAFHTIALANELWKNGFKLTAQERAVGQEIAGLVSGTYGRSATLLDESFIVTRIFCYLREFFQYPMHYFGQGRYRVCSPVRWAWEKRADVDLSDEYAQYGVEFREPRKDRDGYKYIFHRYNTDDYKAKAGAEPTEEYENSFEPDFVSYKYCPLSLSLRAAIPLWE